MSVVRSQPRRGPADQAGRLRAVIYARYSTDLQSEHSIDDQVRLCRVLAENEGFEVVGICQDAGISGASTHLRPGYGDLLRIVQSGAVDAVIAEALDRLSRDQADIADFFKRAKFKGVTIHTRAEGIINELHIGLKGTMNALQLKDLAQKTHRGLEGRVLAGKSGGGLCYGYEVVIQHDARGERVRGDLRINPGQAEIIRWIFERFAAGESPLAIAKQLNADGVPGPRGKTWADTTLRGHATRGSGILRNRLYIGERVWDRQRYVKDPDTGRRISRTNPADQVISVAVPDLRIIDQALWDRVAERLGQIQAGPIAQRIREGRYWEHRRPKHLLTGLVSCGICGASLSAIGKDYLACPNARRRGTCANKVSVRRDAVETFALDALQHHLMVPEAVDAFVNAYNDELTRAQSHAAQAIRSRERELAQVQAQIDKLIDALADGIRSPDLQKRLDTLDRRKRDLVATISSSARPSRPLPGNIAALYRNMVVSLRESLAAIPTIEAAECLRGLIDRVVVQPAPARPGERKARYALELHGILPKMIGLALGQANNNGRPDGVSGVVPDVFDCSVKVVAGIGFEPMTSRL